MTWRWVIVIMVLSILYLCLCICLHVCGYINCWFVIDGIRKKELWTCLLNRRPQFYKYMLFRIQILVCHTNRTIVSLVLARITATLQRHSVVALHLILAFIRGWTSAPLFLATATYSPNGLYDMRLTITLTTWLI